MCGMFGAITSEDLFSDDLIKLRKLLLVNSFRGDDSTGIFDVVDISKDFKWKKETKEKKKPARCTYTKTTDSPGEFAKTIFDWNSYTRWKDFGKNRVIAGHTRLATRGKITKENAHPFLTSKLIGMHNGTIVGDFHRSKDFETDSEALFYNITEFGVEEAIKKVAKEATTFAYAIVFLDLTNHKLHIARNFHRPLHYYIDGNTMFWSSEARDINYVFPMSSSASIHPFKADTLYTFTLDGTEEEKKKWKETELSDGTAYYPVKNYKYEGEGGHGAVAAPYSAYDNSDEAIYGKYWKTLGFDTLKQRGNVTAGAYQKNYDFAFDRWYAELPFKMIEMWKDDHPEEYYGKYSERYNSLSKKEKAEHNKQYPPFTKSSVPAIKKQADNIISLFHKEKEHGDLIHPFGVLGQRCSTERYLEIIKDGCAYCSDTIEIDTVVGWFNDKEFVCKACVEDALEDKKKDKEDHILIDMYGKERVKDVLHDIQSIEKDREKLERGALN